MNRLARRHLFLDALAFFGSATIRSRQFEERAWDWLFLPHETVTFQRFFCPEPSSFGIVIIFAQKGEICEVAVILVEQEVLVSVR